MIQRRFNVGVLEATPERDAWHASGSPRETIARSKHERVDLDRDTTRFEKSWLSPFFYRKVWRLPEPKKKSSTWAEIKWHGDVRKRVTHQLLDPTTFCFCMEETPMVPDGAVLNRWAMLLDPTTFARLRVRRRALFPPARG